MKQQAVCFLYIYVGCQAYTLVALDSGQTITFKVTPVADSGASPGVDVISSNSITVVNSAPVITSANTASVAENQTAVMTVTYTDTDLPANTILYNIVGGADAALFNIDGSGNLSFIAAPDFDNPADADLNNDYVVQVQVDDQQGGTATQTITITVTNVNEAPTDITLSNATLAENMDTTGGVVVGNLSATDVDAGETFTYAVVGGADQAVFTTSGNQLLIDDGVLDFETQNSYVVDVEVTDQGGLTFTKTFTITVTDVNEAPTFSSAAVTAVNEDAPYSYAITTSDVDAADTRSIAGTTLPAWLTLSDNGDGTASLSGTPTNAEVGTHNVVLTVTDAGGLTDTQSFTITVSNTNDAPTVANAIPDQVATEDMAFSFTFAANTFNDVDVGDSLTYTSDATGWLSFDPVTRTFSGTPLNADVGTTTVTVTATDGSGASVSDTFDIVVNNVNDAPVTTDDAFTVNEGSTTNLDLAFNDTDVDDGLDLTSITIVSGPTNGTITVNADGTVDYAHDGSETLADSFIYTIDDLSGTTSNTGIVSLTITPVNDAPVASNDNLTTLQGTALTITTATNLLGNDTDAEGDSLSITGFTQPANGTVVNNGNGTWTYTPNPTFSGVDSFTYTVNDGNGGTATATLNVTVNGVVDDTSNTSSETQLNNDTLTNIVMDSVSNDDKSVQEAIKRDERQQIYETTTARDVSALLSVLNPVHVLSQIDVVDEVSNIYGTDRSMNADLESGLGNGLINNELLWQELDQLRNAINGSNDEDGIFKGDFSNIIISLGGLSVTSGLIAWLLRGGSLAASFISAMPLWKGVDPLPVLTKNKRDEEDDDDDATSISADKRVERLIKGDSSHW